MMISLARWSNTAIIVFVVTPFTSVLTKKLLFQVYTILFADLITYPLYRILDPISYVSRWVLGPLAKGGSQASVNSYFGGGAVVGCGTVHGHDEDVVPLLLLRFDIPCGVRLNIGGTAFQLCRGQVLPYKDVVTSPDDRTKGRRDLQAFLHRLRFDSRRAFVLLVVRFPVR
jgi:hypothetical protein